MSLNVNINPLNFREMSLREPQGARQFGEAIDAWKRGSARRRAEEERQRKQALDNELADMLDVDKAIEDIDTEIKKLEAENKALESQAAPKPMSVESDFTDFQVV